MGTPSVKSCRQRCLPGTCRRVFIPFVQAGIKDNTRLSVLLMDLPGIVPALIALPHCSLQVYSLRHII